MGYLPTEILEMIFSSPALAYADILSISQTCRQFNRVAQSQLHQEARLICDGVAFHIFPESLSYDKELYKYVKTLSLNIIGSKVEVDDMEDFLEEILDHLQLFTKLRCVSARLQDNRNREDIAQIYLQAIDFLLRTQANLTSLSIDIGVKSQLFPQIDNPLGKPLNLPIVANLKSLDIRSLSYFNSNPMPRNYWHQTREEDDEWGCLATIKKVLRTVSPAANSLQRMAWPLSRLDTELNLSMKDCIPSADDVEEIEITVPHHLDLNCNSLFRFDIDPGRVKSLTVYHPNRAIDAIHQLVDVGQSLRNLETLRLSCRILGIADEHRGHPQDEMDCYFTKLAVRFRKLKYVQLHRLVSPGQIWNWEISRDKWDEAVIKVAETIRTEETYQVFGTVYDDECSRLLGVQRLDNFV